MRRGLWLLGALALGASAVGAACDAGVSASTFPTDDPLGALPIEEPALRVRTAAAAAVPDALHLREVGRLEPWRRVTLAAEAQGRVVEIAGEVSDRVAPAPTGGDPVVVRLDPEPYDIALRLADAAVASAEAQRKGARLAHERVIGLFARNLVPDSERDRAVTELDLAEAALAQALARRDDAALWRRRAEVRAPAGYRIAERLVEPREVVAPGQPLVLLVDDRRLRLRFEVAGQHVDALRALGSVEVEIKGAGQATPARLIRIGPEADPRSGRFPVEAEVPNADGALLAGLTAVARVALVRSEVPLVTIPRAALVERLKQQTVLVADAEGIVRRRVVEPVSAPHLDPSRVAVRGLAAGERVVLDHVATLADGQRVDATDPLAAGASAEPWPSSPGS